MDLITTMTSILARSFHHPQAEGDDPGGGLAPGTTNMLAVAWLQKGAGVSLPEAVAVVEAIDQVLKAP